MPYTQEQESRFRQEWSRRATRQGIKFFILVVFLVAWYLGWRYFRDSVAPLPLMVRGLILYGPPAVIILLMRTLTRCPACKVAINTRLKVESCPACGLNLE